jgi:hypothetical protein
MHHGGAKQRNMTLALALEPSISVNNTNMSWQCVYSPLKSYVVDDDQVVAWCRCRVMLAIVPSSHAGDGVTEVTLAMAWCRCRVMLVMALLSHVGDGVITKVIMHMSRNHQTIRLVWIFSQEDSQLSA